jgi:hypothetical protein
MTPPHRTGVADTASVRWWDTRPSARGSQDDKPAGDPQRERLPRHLPVQAVEVTSRLTGYPMNAAALGCLDAALTAWTASEQPPDLPELLDRAMAAVG